jgi:hypothetical protein
MRDRTAVRDRVHGGLLILVVLFVVAAAGSLALVTADLAIGRPALGDVFIAVLNSSVATVLWSRLADYGGRKKAHR